MEEGGEIGLCYNEHNKDHLATVKDSPDVKKRKKERWLVCGFNGFGQFRSKNKRKLSQFEEIQIPLANNNAGVLVACSWNCLTVANGCSLYQQGFIRNCPRTVQSVQTEVPIKCLDVCDKYCLVLLENGKVYKLVPEEEGELKEIKFQSHVAPTISQTKKIYRNSKVITYNLQISHVACGNNIAVAVSTANGIFSGTTQIYQLPTHQHTKQLKCGFEHALLLTTNGDIYAWGNGLRGQLGLDILLIEETPTLIEALAGIKISYVSAGGWHSAAISAFGDLYTWGFNSNGQLGMRIYKTSAAIVKEATVYPTPQLVEVHNCLCGKNLNDIENPCYPIKVANGGRHTILLMNCGSILASGWNLYGQLGLISQKYCDKFEFVFKLDNENDFKNTEIICDSWCTILKT